VIGSWIVDIVSWFVGIVIGFLPILQDFFVGLTVLTMPTVSCRLLPRKGLGACSVATAAAFTVLGADLAQGGRQAFEPCAKGVGSAGPVLGMSDVFVHQITEGLPELTSSSAPFTAVLDQCPHGLRHRVGIECALRGLLAIACVGVRGRPAIQDDCIDRGSILFIGARY
jgi:hypothetical protein